MKRVIVGIGGTLSGIFIALSGIADAHDTTTLAISMMGKHTPEEWTKIAYDYAYAGIAGIVFTAIALVIVAVIEAAWNKQ